MSRVTNTQICRYQVSKDCKFSLNDSGTCKICGQCIGKTCRGEIKWITAATLNSIGVASGLIDPKATFHFKISSKTPRWVILENYLVTIFDKRGLTH